MEARCYGFAKRFSPFLVNTVVGFIGPEYLYDARQVTRAGLEDHFMGKLTGISMGCDCCYTNHMKADQNDIENLASLLTMAGCNYFMGIPHGDDIMLNYQTTGFRETAALREIIGPDGHPRISALAGEDGLRGERTADTRKRATGQVCCFDPPAGDSRRIAGGCPCKEVSMEFDKDLTARQEARELARRAETAQRKLAELSQSQLDAIVEAVAKAFAAQASALAEMAVQETGFGNRGGQKG